MKEYTPLVSVIVPVYNTDEHLDQGIQSLLKQNYANVEIILVDDYSTDCSWKICKKYANKHENVFAFRNKKNSGGPLRGRARGIQEAHGEWITFMDCDDYVKPMYIENLVKTTDGGKYDIAVTGHSRLHPDGRVEDFFWDDYSQSTQEKLSTFYKHFLDRNFWTDPSDTVGQHLIRASVAKKTDFSKYPDTIACEDTLMSLAFLNNSENGVNFVDHHDFYWRQREGSGSRGGFAATAKLPEFYRASYDIFFRNKLLPLVSVVIPVFKVEKYLGDCVDSVLAQIYPNLEVILVDDKSPDGSGAIADEYSATDRRVKVIHKQKNEGLNMARSTGFKASSGVYVTFVDSDDLLTDDCIMVAITALIKNETDFVRFGMLRFKNEADIDGKLDNLPADKEVVLKGKKDLYMTQFDQAKVLGELPILNMTVWGALYTSRLVGRVDWIDTNYRAYEDNIWTLRFLENASSCVYLGRIGYLYRSDDSIIGVLGKSLSGNTFNGKPIGYMEFWNYIWDEYRRYNKKHKLGADQTIEDLIRYLYIVRASHLTKADLWGIENNIQYLPQVVKIYQEVLDMRGEENVIKEERIKNLELENSLFIEKLVQREAELKSYLSIKRSSKLTLGNIKRRVVRLAPRGFNFGK